MHVVCILIPRYAQKGRRVRGPRVRLGDSQLLLVLRNLPQGEVTRILLKSLEATGLE